MKFTQLASLIGFLLLMFIISQIGVEKLMESVREARAELIIFYLLLFVPLMLLQAFKWDFLMRHQGICLPFTWLLKVQTIGLFYELITPARIGSFIKISYINEKIKNFGKSAGSVVIDRGLDFLVVAFLAVIGSLYLLNSTEVFFYSSFIVFLLFCVGFGLLLNKKLSRIPWKIAYVFLLKKNLKERARNSTEEFYKALPGMNALFGAAVLTAAFWLLAYTQAYILAAAFNITIPFIEFVLLFPISVIISLLPISISGFGTREASLLVILSSFAIPKNNILAFSLAWAAIPLLLYAVAVIPLLIMQGKKKNSE